jgi:hypothetical protein
MGNSFFLGGISNIPEIYSNTNISIIANFTTDRYSLFLDQKLFSDKNSELFVIVVKIQAYKKPLKHLKTAFSK